MKIHTIKKSHLSPFYLIKSQLFLSEKNPALSILLNPTLSLAASYEVLQTFYRVDILTPKQQS